MRLNAVILGLVAVGCVVQPDSVSKNLPSKSGKIITEIKIDQKGGVLDVVSTGTPLDNVSVTVPPGAILQESMLRIGYDMTPIKIKEGKWCGVTLLLEVNPDASFMETVAIKIPFKPIDGSDMVVPYEVDTESRLHVMSILHLDPDTHTITVATWKACAITWVFI